MQQDDYSCLHVLRQIYKKKLWTKPLGLWQEGRYS